MIASILTAVMIICSIPINVSAAPNYKSELNGWKVKAVWNETLTTDYEWDAKKNESKHPKVNVSYRLENASQDYPAGSVCFTIPGIGNLNRDSVAKAQTAGDSSTESEWLCSWDSTTDIYTFTNNFDVKEGDSLSGGFELAYDLQARDCMNEFSQERSPVFSIAGAGEIQMIPLVFHFGSVRDKYRLRMDRRTLNGTDYSKADKNFIWYDFTTSFDSDYLARGLNKTSYAMQVKLPDGMDASDLRAKHNGKSLSFTEIEAGTYELTVFRNRYGDLSTDTETGADTIRIGFNAELLEGKEVTVSGHLDRLYQDEAEWENQAGANENVDVETSFTVESYGFTSEGYSFDIYKYNQHEASGAVHDHDAPSDENRLPSVALYNGTIIPFTLKGVAMQSYAEGISMHRGRKSRRVRIATSSDADFTASMFLSEDHEDIPENWDDMNWEENGYEIEADDSFWELPTYEEIHGEESYENSATPSNAEGDDEDKILPDLDIFKGFSRMIRQIASSFSTTAFAAEKKATASEAEDKTKTATQDTDVKYPLDGKSYDMVIGDDKLAITMNNGQMRNLEDDEYDFSYVSLPSVDGTSYAVEVYGAATQDTPFAEYRQIFSGNSGESKTILLPAGIKAIYICINDIANDFTYQAVTGIRMHLDWNTEQAKEEELRPNHEDKMANFAYERIMVAGEDGNKENIVSSEYAGSYGEALKERDESLYGECPLREYSHVWIRNLATNAFTSTELNEFEGSAKTGYQTTITAKGHIRGESEGPLTKFSMYIVLPEGLEINADSDALDILGTAVAEEDLSTIDLPAYTSASIREENGKTILCMDVDLEDCPARIDRDTKLTVSFPAYVSYENFQTYGGYYSVETDLMIHDDGIENLTGGGIKSDEYDLDNDGRTDDKIAFSSDHKTIKETATEWREYANKYVKSAYSKTFGTETVTRLYQDSDTEENKEKSKYEYKLEYSLGSDEAKNIIFYDRLERGAELSEDSGTAKVSSEWQGLFESVDTSQPEKIGLIPTVYYSENASQEFDVTASGWTTVCPDDHSKIKAIAIALDASALENEALSSGQKLHVRICMRAPQNRAYVDKTAVNQFTVTYDAYDVGGAFKQNYSLSSTATYVKLLDSVGRITLQKVDADRIIRTDADGTKHFASLAGAKIQVYDPDGKALFAEGGKKVDNFGRLILQNIKYGTYSWEETEAPEGYEKQSGRHPFEINETSSVIYIENQRVRGSVTLTKLDRDHKDTALAGASYRLYDADDQIVCTTDQYMYDLNGTVDHFTTAADGTFTITGLPWGTYYFLETEAPTGYLLSQSKIRFEIGSGTYNKEKDTIHVSVTGSDQEKTSAVILTKKDAENGKSLKGAYYELYKKVDGEWKLSRDTLKTNAAGEITVDGLKFGEYKFKEIMPPAGYKISTLEPEFAINADNAGETVTVSHKDERKNGSAQLVKTDREGVPLAEATFSLYKVGEKTPVAEDLVTDETGATPETSELTWGEYYYLETKAPLGYSKSSSRYEFTISAENADVTQKIQVANNRLLGTVVLTKMDEATKSICLSGAEFTLYNGDGSVVKTGLTTGEDGTVTVKDLDWGSYYFEETRAPEGYSLSNTKTRFSINAENASSVQRVTCYDPVGLAELTINKEINEAYSAFGNAQFLFEVKGTDVNGNSHTFTRTLTIAEGTDGSITITGIPAGTYTVRELGVSRYKQEEVTGVLNVTCDADTGVATATLTAEGKAEVTFKNQISQYEKFSHNAGAMNIVSTKAQITGLRADYTGEEVLKTGEENYSFTAKNLSAVVLYDDGTTKKIPFSDLHVTPASISTQYGGSYIIKVSYTESGVTVSDEFTVTVTLEKPEGSFTVTYFANGGYFGDDTARTANQVNYQMQDDSMTVVSGTEMEPQHLEKIFDGWYLDAACTDGNQFQGVNSLTSDIAVYAKYKQGVSMIDSSKFSESLVSNGLISDTRPSSTAPAADKKTTKVGDTTFWEEDGILRYYPDDDVSSSDTATAIGNLGFSNADITAVLRSDTKPDASKAQDISGSGSNTPIYLWKDGNTLYWWSQAKHPVLPKWSSWLFANYPNLTDISGLADFDASKIYSVSCIFRGDSSLADLTPISYWNVSNITTANSMFKDCASIENLNALSEWRFSTNLENMSSMLNGCSALEDISGMKNWGAKPTNIQWMLCGAAVKSLDGIEGIDPSTPGTKIRAAFSDLTSLTDISALSAWDDKVADLDPETGLWALFAWDHSLTSLDGLQGWKLDGVKTLRETFVGCNLSGLEQLVDWNVSTVETMERTFAYNQNLISLQGLESWDTSSLMSLSNQSAYGSQKTGTFLNCTSLKDISALKTWNTSNLVYATATFYYCDALSDLSPLAGWDTGNLQKADGMFYGCWRLTSPAWLANWNTSSLQTTQEMFGHCGLTSLAGLDSWDSSSMTNISSMFAENELTNISAVSSWFNGNNHLILAAQLFAKNSDLSDISALKNWNVSGVTDLSGAFAETSITSVEALAEWNTDNVTLLSGTFKNTQLKTLTGLEKWNVSKVSDFREAFAGLTKLTDASAINDWDISGGSIFEHMFQVSGGTAVVPEFSKRTGKFDSDGTFVPETE